MQKNNTIKRSKNLTVKYMFNGSLRRTKLKKHSFSELLNKIEQSFPQASRQLKEKKPSLFVQAMDKKNSSNDEVKTEQRFVFRYVDEEDELVSITCDHELSEAFRVSASIDRILVIYIDDYSNVDKLRNRWTRKSLRGDWRCNKMRKANKSNWTTFFSDKDKKSPISATFVKDVSVKDCSYVLPSEKFVKVWKLNTLSGVPKGCVLKFVHGHSLACLHCLSLPKVPAKEDFDITLEVHAPKDDGHYRSYFKLFTAEGKSFGPKLWLDFYVGSTNTTATQKKTPKDKNLKVKFVKDVTIPDASIVEKNQKLTKTWKLQSFGQLPEGSMIQFVGGNQLSACQSVVVPKFSVCKDCDYKRITGLPQQYLSGNKHNVTVICDGCDKRHLEDLESYWHSKLNRFDLCTECKDKGNTAPYNFDVSVEVFSGDKVGRHRSFWRLVTPDGFHFGPKLWVDICVRENRKPVETSLKKQIKEGNLFASFVEDVTIPDGSNIEASDYVKKVWKLHTSSGLPDGCRLLFVSGNALGACKSVTLPLVASNTEFEIALPIRAPEKSGRYRSDWRLVSPSGQHFGPTLWLEFQVEDNELEKAKILSTQIEEVKESYVEIKSPQKDEVKESYVEIKSPRKEKEVKESHVEIKSPRSNIVCIEKVVQGEENISPFEKQVLFTLSNMGFSFEVKEMRRIIKRLKGDIPKIIENLLK